MRSGTECLGARTRVQQNRTVNEEPQAALGGNPAGMVSASRQPSALALPRDSDIALMPDPLSGELFRALIHTGTAAVVLTTLEGRVVFVNEQAYALFGFCDFAEAATTPYSAYVTPESLRRLETEGFPKALETGSWWGDIRIQNFTTHELFDCDCRMRLIHDPDTGQELLAVVVRDVSARVKNVRRLEESEARFRRLAENLPDVVFRLTLAPVRAVEYVNPSVEVVLGFTAEECYEQPAILERLLDRDQLRIFDHRSGDAAGKRELRRRQTVRCQRKDGRAVWTETSLTLFLDRGVVTVEGVSRDVTAAKDAEHRLERKAHHDPLTGLANREKFLERLDEALLEHRGLDENLAVLFIDLDHFKAVNDTLGHDGGDRLLVEVAGRLRQAVRPGDLVARLGGDEFTILLEGLDDLSVALTIAERVNDAIGQDLSVDGSDTFVTPSIGIAVANGQNSSTDLMRNADEAMYLAKADGRGRWRVFDERLREQARRRIEEEALLRHAVERGELLVHFQPEVDSESGTLRSVEALMRWQHPQRGLVPAGEFIALAESTGLITALGNLVLERAVRQLTLWDRQLGTDQLVVRVNVSAKQLNLPGFPAMVGRLLDECGINPNRLSLDVEEAVVVRAPEPVSARLAELTKLGVRIVVDDFGRGSSSLRYLRRFPIDGVKIDAALLAGLGHGPDGRPIASGLVQLARSFSLDVIATAVQDVVTIPELREFGCNGLQGNAILAPLPAEDIEPVLRAWRVGLPRFS